MRIAHLFYVAACGSLAFTAGADAQARRASTAGDAQQRLRAAVEAATGRATAAWNRGDIDGFIQAYAPEVWVFPPNAEPFQGRAAASDYFARGYTDGTRNLQLTTTGLDRSGDMAYETGTYRAEFPTPGRQGATSRDFGKYVHVWKRDPSGAWRIHLVTWNSNLPPTPMPR
jgi:ketosteroid isomerase-like protein